MSAQSPWRTGNRLELLENGEEFFPAVFEAIAAAHNEVLIETFILFEDGIGTQLKDTLVAAARRGVRIDLTVDSYGSPDLSEAFIGELTSAGVRLHIYDPHPTVLGVRTHIFRRLHRKIVVVDAHIAFIGGINYSDDHMIAHGPEAKQDYALRCTGPIVGDIHAFALAAIGMGPQRLRRKPSLRHWRDLLPQRAPARSGDARAMFVTRDNDHHRSDIERQYRMAIRAAQHEVIIANAYFFPGYPLIRELQRAARRGVAVHLIIQGKPDQWLAQFAATALYGALLKKGVKIYEYCDRPMHAKVATADDDWATVGSSNLDPLSLYLNLECNIVALDPALNADLRARLHTLMQHSCKAVCIQAHTRWSLPRLVLSWLAFYLMRRFPAWASAIPRHRPRWLLRAQTPTALDRPGASSRS